MRKRTIHKAAAALTALALCAGVLTGCGGAASSTTASSTAGSAASSEVSGEEADELAAKNVADLIDAIYVQERTDDTDAQCEAAKAAWDALTDAQKELVGNYQTLLDAEAKLADLQAADAVEKLIDAIGTPVTLDSEAAIVAAREAYDKLTEAQKQAVKNKLLATTSYQTFDVYYHVDPTLIGGMVIRVGDRVVDSSIRTKLEDMKKQLLNIQLG